MILRKFGIQLQSLEHKDIHITRNWRNANFVRQNMIFDQEITRDMQEVWFRNLSDTDVYLVISHNAVQIGVVNVKAIDWVNRVGEAGVFIGNPEYLKSYIPMLAIISLMDAFFDEFSFSALKATVKKGNKEAIDFNYSLGYQLESEKENTLELTVSKKSYKIARKNLSKITGAFEKKKETHSFSEREKSYLFLRK